MVQTSLPSPADTVAWQTHDWSRNGTASASANSDGKFVAGRRDAHPAMSAGDVESVPAIVPETPSLPDLPATRQVYVWGAGDLGQLGTGTRSAQLQPVPVKALAGVDVVEVAASIYNTAFLTSRQELFLCGANESGQLGRPAQSDAELTPVRLTALDSCRVTHCALGHSHVQAATDAGAIATWGASEFGQLGQGRAGEDQPTPRVIKGTREVFFTQVACGAAHSLTLTGSGHVFSFGCGAFGALGLGDEDNQDLPVLVERLWPVAVVQVSCGDNHSAALSMQGAVWTWGRGKFGQLGFGHLRNVSVPARVDAMWEAGVEVAHIACGGDHTCAVSRNGEVFTWGRGSWGQLGHGTLANEVLPRQVVALAGKFAVQAAAGSRHTLVLTVSGRVHAFGSGESGQLGTGTDAMHALPVRVQGLRGLHVTRLAAGGLHSCAVGDLGAGWGPAGIRTGQASMDKGPRVPGAGMGFHRREMPPLLELAQVAANPLAPRKAVAAAARAVEDVFSSPGMILAGFAVETPTPVDGRHGLGAGPRVSSWEDEEGQETPDLASPSVMRARSRINPHFHPPATGYSGSPGARDTAAGASRGRLESGGESDIDLFGEAILSSERSDLNAADDSAWHQRQWVETIEAEPHGLDMNAVQDVFRALLRIYSGAVVTALGSACGRLLEGMKRSLISVSGAPEREWLPALLAALQNPLHSAIDSGPRSATGGPGLSGAIAATLLEGISHVVSKLSVDSKSLLAVWISELPPDVVVIRVLRPLHTYVTELVLQAPVQGWEAVRERILMAAHVVDTVHRASALAGGRAPQPVGVSSPTRSGLVLDRDPLDPWAEQHAIPAQEFYNRALGTLSDELLDFEYRQWVSSSAGEDGASPLLLSLCQVPYMLDSETKSRILLLEALYQKQHEVRTAHIQALAEGTPHDRAQWLYVRVRRSHLLEDTLRQVVQKSADLKKPLRVTFVSAGVQEEGLDEGGVAKEFFQLLVRELVDASYGMFAPTEGGRYTWFDTRSTEPPVSFQLVGMLLGLAIYNGHILDIHLPPVAYKKLLGVEPTLDDLRAAFPTLAHGLQQLLDYTGDVEADLCYMFRADIDVGGQRSTVDLVPGGELISVTSENRGQFVELYVRHVLSASVQEQFDAFAAGFMQVCGGPALSMFSPRELELLVCGLPHLDFEALQKATQYEGGYGPEHPVIKWFWEIVHGMSLEDKKRFLSFTTGCDRAPIGGLGALQLVLQRNGGDTMRLPTAHTCFNVLLLPEYASFETLRDRLLLAIGNARGFGLQ